MTTQADYTDEEWAALRRAPLVAGLAISLADPGGPIELTKETLAALKAARTPPSDDELLMTVSKDLDEQVRTQGKPLEGFEVRGRTARKQVVEELGVVNGILAAKATPEEAASFRMWLVQAAEGAAEAAKEGGVLGIAATRVSKREAAMLDTIRELLGSPRAEGPAMGNVIGDILPLAIVVAISPVPIIAVILVLFSARARTNGPAFPGGLDRGAGRRRSDRPRSFRGGDLSGDSGPSTTAGVVQLILSPPTTRPSCSYCCWCSGSS